MDYRNLFIALIILVCLLIVLFAIYVLNHHVKRDRKTPPSSDHNGDLEANLSSHQTARAGVTQEHSSDESRLSRLTIVAPSIELLPEIKTNKDRAEDWLDRRDSRATDGDIGLESLTLQGVENDGDADSKCRDGRSDGGAKDEKRTNISDNVR